jgi:hypothetical protein
MGVAPPVISTIRPDCQYGGGWNKTVRITENIALFAPIPIAKIRIAKQPKLDCLRNWRVASRKSCTHPFIRDPLELATLRYSSRGIMQPSASWQNA